MLIEPGPETSFSSLPPAGGHLTALRHPCPSWPPAQPWLPYASSQARLISALSPDALPPSPGHPCQMVELVRLLRPQCVTLEEVVTFLAAKMPRVQLKLQKGLPVPLAEAQQPVLVCPWLEFVPQLLEMEYQIDIRLLNAVHFATPQRRMVCTAWCAPKGGPAPGSQQPGSPAFRRRSS